MNDIDLSRRDFIGATLATTIGGSAMLSALKTHAEETSEKKTPETFDRKIKLGVVGLGGRGSWIAQLFRDHGGYDLHAVADYFPEVAQSKGKELGVDASRRFSGLSGYRKLIESGVEAIAIEDVPYFFPEQAAAAVAAGLHVYIAKPVAVDVPGVLSIEESGKAATKNQRVFLVDYQMPTDPIHQEIARRVSEGALGPLRTIFSNGLAGGEKNPDPPLTKTIESRLQNLTWIYDTALGSGWVTNFDIHIIDAVLWTIGRRRPVSAHGWADRYRSDPHGDAQDSTGLMFAFADGVVWNHQSVMGKSDDWFAGNGELTGYIQGRDGGARLSYLVKAYIRGGAMHYSGGIPENLYPAGAQRNIARFYREIIEGNFENATIQRAVDSTLTCLLGREAALRSGGMTMDELLRENKKLEVDLTGLKA